MAVKRMDPIGLAVLVLTATATCVLAQAPLGTPVAPEVAVSPATPRGLLGNESTGLNPLTGLPCSGGGASAITGVGGLGDTTTPPPGGDLSVEQLPPPQSIYGTGSTLGAC
jgi:hypothetical protein